jgi:phospholipase/lecithinase/hemolysin
MIEGGARSDDGTSQLSQVPGLDVWNVGKQVTEYVNAGGSFGPTTLVTIWAGGNDLLFDQADPADAAQNVADAVNDLIGAGAREFLVLNQVPLGETPGARAQGPAVQAFLNGLSAAYRAELASRLAVWDADPDVTVHQLDVYALFSDVLADPTAYGFQNIEDPAINLPAANPDEFVFWDDFHPTTAGHSVIAGQVRIVPEPAALALIGVGGLIVSTWLAQRRLVRRRF